jgi:hypothetical protein
VNLLGAEDIYRARRGQPWLLDARDRIHRQPVCAACARHHAVEDHDDLSLRRVRQRPVRPEPPGPPINLVLGDVLETARTERRQEMVGDH